ncbi:anaerobic ribonucleoside-triphosphate reductase activating protein [Lentisphaerota bacterium WC36G]|nr:anaerobic ribonucleoside-triphosphate reductase activating protein [Lentisphaerae bacterium WC36]
MKIFGLQKFSLIDYPGKLACVVFTGGCNFSCPYCHNPCLVLAPESQEPIDYNDFFEFLRKRQGKLDGVVVSGGEPTLQKKLKKLIVDIKKLDFLVKLDTNGSNFEVVKELVDDNLIDSIGIDYKASSNDYAKISGNKNINGIDVLKVINYSVKKLRQKNVDIRTTVHKSLLSFEELKVMWSELKLQGVEEWYLQQYHDVEVLDLKLSNETWTNSELEDIAQNISPKIKIRNI